MLLDGDSGWSELYCSLKKGLVKVTDIKKGEIYKWDEKKKLWLEVDKAVIVADIQQTILEQAKYCYGKKKKSELKKIVQLAKKVKPAKEAFELVKVKLLDEEFVSLINSKVDELPIAKGKLIKLRTGVVRDRTQSDYFTFSLDVSYVNNKKGLEVNDKVLNFIMDICNGDKDLYNYLQELLGLCLTGINERQLYICWGDGNNGKTTLFGLLANVLKGYAGSLPDGALMNGEGRRSKDSATLALNPIKGKKFVMCDESGDQDKLDTSLIKRLANEEGTISLRENYGDFTEEKIQCKAFLATNKIPNFDHTDEAVVKRLRFIPFNARFFDPSKESDRLKLAEGKSNYKVANKDLVKEIKTKYLDDFFSWLVEGCIRYFDRGSIHEPKLIFQTTKNVTFDKDSVKRFMTSCIALSEDDITSDTIFQCDSEATGPEWRTSKDSIYREYFTYVKDVCGGLAETKAIFYKRLVGLGVKEVMVRGQRCFKLKRVIEEEEQDV